MVARYPLAVAVEDGAEAVARLFEPGYQAVPTFPRRIAGRWQPTTTSAGPHDEAAAVREHWELEHEHAVDEATMNRYLSELG